MQHSMIKLIVPADIISILNALFGFIAILVLSINPIYAYRLSFTFILLALLADGLDGIVARKTRKGEMGPYLESMADLTSTGIATGFFVFHIYYNQLSNQPIFVLISLIGVVSFYLICSIIRLAAFHPLKTTDYFMGLPAPAAAIILITCTYLNIPFFYCIFIILLLSFLMISTIHYLKPLNKIGMVTASLIFLVIIFDTVYNSFFIWLLLVLSLLYMFIGPIAFRHK